MIRSKTKRMTAAGILIALGVLVPSAFHLFGPIGAVFLPMHIPVLLCGILCGGFYGTICGFMVPLISSLITGMPPIFPVAFSMMFELAAYGAISGICYDKFRQKIYPALITAMLGGRVVYGIVNTILFNMAGKPFGFEAFISGAFITAFPGIVIQLVLIPLMAAAIKKMIQHEAQIK